MHRSTVSVAFTTNFSYHLYACSKPSMHSLWTVLILLHCLHLAAGLKFDLVAQPPHNKAERCIRNFVNRDTLVVVTAILDGSRGDGQVVNMHVCGNPGAVAGDQKRLKSILHRSRIRWAMITDCRRISPVKRAWLLQA